MLVSFLMDDATETRSNRSEGTSGRARHEGLFDSGEDSRDYSGENALISKCHCSVTPTAKDRLRRAKWPGEPVGGVQLTHL